ncbi:EF-hand domain pair [Pristimantis euphronides]
MSSHLLSPPRSSMPRLPIIEHPLSRLSDPETLSLRGFSRGEVASQREDEVPETRRNIETVLSSYRDRSLPLTPLKHHIPEGVQVTTATDQNKSRLPIFGQSAAIRSRAESRGSTATSTSSSVSRPGTQLRVEVDELEHTLREKLKSGGYFSLRQMFRNNDPEGKGQVNRDVLLMMLSKFLGRPISSKSFQQLLLRLKLHEKTIIRFEELYAAARDPVTSGRPTWLDPVNRKVEESLMTASQVHAQLKTKERFAELTKLISEKPDGSTRILFPEFRDILGQLGFCIEDEEFSKLCKRYDVDGTSVIKADFLLKRLGKEIQSTIKNKVPLVQSREMSRAEQERKASLNIEKWLKDKFREGFRSMKDEFERHDPQKIGQVDKMDFLAVLEKFDLKLKEEHFNLFLARCGLENSLTGISYMDLLRNFQDRSDKGITHKILCDPNHRFHREGAISPSSTLTAVEARLTNLFQSDFLALLATFEKIDKFKRNVVSQQEFRAAIESRFGVEITDEDFEQLLDRIPLDEDGNVRYPHFMAMFDSRRGVPSLFDQRSLGISAFEEDKEYGTCPGRTQEQLFKMIKSLIHENYAVVEKEFEDLDIMNSRRLTQETMYFLLKRFDIQPGVTRGEIRRLWSTFITNQDKTLDYLEFVRHFRYSPKSACYPNAKISPPKKGDGDFMIRSKKLNCDSDILIDNVRAKVEYLWDDLRREFEDLDPYYTGFVSKEEFKDLLSELCIHLNDYEREMLSRKFESNGDGRVSYIEFLKPFVPRRQALKTKTNMEAVMWSSQSEADPSEHYGNALGTLTSRMRKKLKGEWKTLRRAFKKLDMDSSGYLSLPEFRSVLKLCNFVLDEDEVFHIMSKYDQNMDGRVNYKSFLEHTCKKESPSSLTTPLANTV